MTPPTLGLRGTPKDSGHASRIVGLFLLLCQDNPYRLAAECSGRASAVRRGRCERLEPAPEVSVEMIAFYHLK
jgi:hypothetical protein